MRALLSVFMAVLLTSPAYAILGDLNRDGRVDYVDFFVFADNFGKEGPPEPADTIVVEQKEPILLGQFKTGPYWLFGMAATMGR